MISSSEILLQLLRTAYGNEGLRLARFDFFLAGSESSDEACNIDWKII